MRGDIVILKRVPDREGGWVFTSFHALPFISSGNVWNQGPLYPSQAHTTHFSLDDFQEAGEMSLQPGLLSIRLKPSSLLSVPSMRVNAHTRTVRV